MKFTDILAAALSIAMALGCTLFAGYKIYRLQAMENPPADLGLNFPAKPARRSAVEAVLVDPLATGAVDAAEESTVHPRRIAQPYRDESPVREYRLLAVIDGIAFVEVTKLRGKEVWPVGEGSILPGAGAVSKIEKIAGRWQVTAGSEIIAAGQ